MVLGTLCLVPDSTLVRMIDAGSLTTSAWRGGLTAIALAGYLVVRYRSRVLVVFRSVGWPGALSAVLWTANSIMFVASVDRTAVANTLVILSTAPLFAAVMGRIVLDEAVARRTWVAIGAAIAGVGITLAGSLEGGGTSGDLLAFGVAIVVAANLTVLRFARHVDMVPAACLGGALTAVILPAAGVSVRLASGDVAPIVLMGLAFIPAALALVTTGTRLISGPEVALILVLETVLGPIVAWLAVDEPASIATGVGGAVVVTAVVAHAVASLRALPSATTYRHPVREPGGPP